MPLQFLDDMISGVSGSHLLSALAHTPFDELQVIHLDSGEFESRYHTDRKFFAPVIGNSFQSLLDYVSSNMIHPEDRETHRAFMNLDDLDDRLSRSCPRGILSARFRCLALSGEWHRMECLLISGPEFGLAEGVVHNYLYDMEEIQRREQGQHAVAMVPARRLLSKMPEQMTEVSFFALVEERLVPAPQDRWCLIAVDIKHFKLFKELNGQEKGERLLIRFAEILHDAAKEAGGLSCYRGQDDYALFYPFDTARIDRIFSDLCRAIDSLSGASGFFPTFGITLIDEEAGRSVLDLFNQAALTAEEIKDDLQHHIRIYDPKVHERHVEEFRLVTEFSEALRSGEITFFLQPQCRVANGGIVGAESLARWRRADGSYISPMVFVPVLEKYGVITDLDRYIWEQVCAWLRRVLDAGLSPVPVSVNVSRIDIFSMKVAEVLSGLIRQYGVPVDLLKVEITESAYVEDSDRVRNTISALRALGFQVLMDDFGSGYSSLNMLRSIDVDVIKLDAQFLHFIVGEEQKGINILESVINMTKSLSTPVIVEGVETRELVKFLTDMGCRYMQGFYFYRPMPAVQFEDLLRDASRIDYAGITRPIHEQIHLREFLDSFYSDAMLNNILGPVAFYGLKDDNVDIVRFNQQFFQLIGLRAADLEKRRWHIQNYIHPDDRQRFFDLFRSARKNRICGESGFLRVYKPGGAIFWMELRVYYLRTEDGTDLFYGSARDMTELLYINSELPGGYCRTTPDDGYEFIYISQGFLSLLGYTEEEIRLRFNNRLLNMIHPDDREKVLQEAAEVDRKVRDIVSPYRLLFRDGSTRYVIDHSRYTDVFGEPCLQTIITDISNIVSQVPPESDAPVDLPGKGGYDA